MVAAMSAVCTLCPGCAKKLTGRNKATLERRALKHLETCNAAKRWAVAKHEARTKKGVAVAAVLAALSAASCLAWLVQ